MVIPYRLGTGGSADTQALTSFMIIHNIPIPCKLFDTSVGEYSTTLDKIYKLIN